MLGFAAVSALLGLAGCAGSADPLHAVRSAATNTLKLTAQSTLTLTDARLFGGTPGPIIGRGEFSFPKGLGYKAVKIPALGPRTAGTAYLVYLPTKLWIRPVVNTALPEGDLWVSAKFTDSRSAGSTTPSLALVLESMNPQLLLEEIATGAVAASSSGHRVINHLPLTEYVVSVDLARALSAAGTTGALRDRDGARALRAPRQSRHGRGLAGANRGLGRRSRARRELQASLPGSKLGTVQIDLWKFGARSR